MKTRNKIILFTALIALAGLLVSVTGRHKKTKRMLTEIADGGYETAPDIMFPGKDQRNKKVKYGPVLPS